MAATRLLAPLLVVSKIATNAARCAAGMVGRYAPEVVGSPVPAFPPTYTRPLESSEIPPGLAVPDPPPDWADPNCGLDEAVPPAPLK